MRELTGLRPSSRVGQAEMVRLRAASKALNSRRCTAYIAPISLALLLLSSFVIVFASGWVPNVGRAELFFTSGDSLSRACGLSVRGVPAQPDARRPAFKSLLGADEIRLICWLHVLNDSVPGVDWRIERNYAGLLNETEKDVSWCGRLVDRTDETWQTLDSAQYKEFRRKVRKLYDQDVYDTVFQNLDKKKACIPRAACVSDLGDRYDKICDPAFAMLTRTYFDLVYHRRLVFGNGVSSNIGEPGETGVDEDYYVEDRFFKNTSSSEPFEMFLTRGDSQNLGDQIDILYRFLLWKLCHSIDRYRYALDKTMSSYVCRVTA